MTKTKATLSSLSLLFWNSLLFPYEEFLVFSSVFHFFSRDFRGSVGITKSFFLVIFLAFFQKIKERKDRVQSAPPRLPTRLYYFSNFIR